MTVANEFIQEVDGDNGSAPVVFGVPVTPKIMGIAIGVGGALLAGFLIYQFLMPALAQGQTLRTDIQTKQEEIEKQDQRLRERNKAEKALADAKVRKATVTALFADEASLNTLLFDINEQINKINAGIIDDTKKAKLTQFTPVQLAAPEEEIVKDGSLGPDVNEKLRRREYEVVFEGSFEQSRQFLIALERLQPMLVVRNLTTKLDDKNSSPVIQGEYKQGRFVPSPNQPQRRLKTNFDLQVLLPLSPEQVEAAAAAAAPPAGQEPPK